MGQISGLPGKRVVGPVLVVPQRGNTAFRYVKDWGTIQQDAPTGVNNKPATLSAFNKKYVFGMSVPTPADGASGTIKSLLMFNAPMKSGEVWKLYPGNQSAVVGAVNFHFPAFSVPFGSWLMSTFVFLKPILAPYSLAGLTWNGFNATPPSLGSALAFETARIDGMQGVPGAGTIMEAYHMLPVIDFGHGVALAADTYGFVIETLLRFDYFVGGYTPTVDDPQCQWSANVSSGPEGFGAFGIKWPWATA